MAQDRNKGDGRRQCAARRARRVGGGGALCLGILIGPDAPAAEVTRHPGGFWKCRAPNHLKGEFGNEDVVGLSAHAHVATDCEVHWSDGQGKTYCFATPPSFLELADHPELLQKAEAFWRLSHPQDRR